MVNLKRRRPVTLLIIIIIIAFTGVSSITFITTKNLTEQEQITSALPLLSENIYSEIQKQIVRAIHISSTMAKDTFLISWITEGEAPPILVRNYLAKIKTDYGLFTAFFISAETEKYYYHEGILKTISTADDHDQWYYNFTESGKTYALDVDNNQAADNRLTVFINHRIEDLEGNYLGVIGVGIELKDLSELLLERGNRHNKTIYLTDNRGLIQVHPDHEKIEKETVFTETGLENDIHQLLDKTPRTLEYPVHTDKGSILITSHYIPELDWFIIIHQNEDLLLKPAWDNLKLNILIGFVTMVLLIILSSVTISRYQRKMEELASTDALTGIFNRREFKARFDEVSYRTRRYNISAAIILIDLDDFKIINDTKGHLIGDQVLIHIARTVRNIIRPDDVFARWGGDEFIILVEKSGQDAINLAERIKKGINESEIDKELSLLKPLTISIGVAEYNKGEVLNDLIQRADQGLYQSKKAGKNTIHFEES